MLHVHTACATGALGGGSGSQAGRTRRQSMCVITIPTHTWHVQPFFLPPLPSFLPPLESGGRTRRQATCAHEDRTAPFLPSIGPAALSSIPLARPFLSIIPWPPLPTPRARPPVSPIGLAVPTVPWSPRSYRPCTRPFSLPPLAHSPLCSTTPCPHCYFPLYPPLSNAP